MFRGSGGARKKMLGWGLNSDNTIYKKFKI
jgi:hypothetical protein